MVESLFECYGHVPVLGQGDPLKISAVIRPGTMPYKGVGQKLQEKIAELSESHTPPGVIDLCRLKEARPDSARLELDRARSLRVSWSHLHQVLQGLAPEVRGLLPTGTQLGVALGHYNTERIIVRVQVNWEEGHNLGLKPEDPDWVWFAGTVFAVTTSAR